MEGILSSIVEVAPYFMTFLVCDTGLAIMECPYMNVAAAGSTEDAFRIFEVQKTVVF
jgi:hypothetical protein